MNKITPAYVREAYQLLRQSIIHVEEDDIDFDEEELEGEREGDRRPRASPRVDGEDSQDVDMSGGQSGIDDMYAESGPAGRATSPNAPGSRAGSAAPPNGEPAFGQPPAAPRPKRRMVITHDKYVTLQSLIVLHLSQVERETGKGVDKDELIDWYLELKEDEIQDVEELEYERELITKMLRKLVKVSLTSFGSSWSNHSHSSYRTTIYWKSVGMSRIRSHRPWKAVETRTRRRKGTSGSTIWSIPPSTRRVNPPCHDT